jgi:hypothetical protein
LPLGALSAVIFLGLCLAVSGCGVPPSDGPRDSFGLDFHLPQGSRTDGAIIFVVDGLNAGIFNDLLDHGQLPAISKYFVDRGLYAPRSVTSHPCITMDILPSIVTGRFPGHGSILAPKWFDRNALIFRHYETLAHKNLLDLEYQVPTLYEQFPDRLTFSIFLQPHRGATKFYENRLSAGPAMLFENYDLVDRISLYRLKDVMDLAREYRQMPAITTIYMLSVNFHAYKYGVRTPQYRQAIIETDRQIGRVLGDIERAGLLDKLHIALVSDHGHEDTPRHAALEGFIRDTLKIPTADTIPTDINESFESRLRRYRQVVAVTYGGGDRYWTLHLRKPIRRNGKVMGYESWLTAPGPEDLTNYPAGNGLPVDLPRELARREGVDAVAYRSGPDSIRLVRACGEVEFTRIHSDGRSNPASGPARDEEMISCRIVAGQDPLGWKGKVSGKALSGSPLDQRDWLRQTWNTDFPDLPEGLLSYFDGRLAADIVVFPAPGWDVDGWRKAGHGGIRDFEMQAPMMLAGPGVPHGRLGAVRMVDLAPTLMELMGKPAAARSMDGRSLLHDAPRTK